MELVTLGPGPDGSVPLDMTTVGAFTGLPMPIVNLGFDRAGRRFVAVSGNGTVSIQTVATPDQSITLGQYQSTGIEAAISPDGSLVAVAETNVLVAVAESNGRITIHSADDGSELTTISGPDRLDRLAFDGSGKRIRASTRDAVQVYTYSLRNPHSAIFGSGLPANADEDGFMPSGNRYFSRNGDLGFRIIDIDAKAEVGTLPSATGATGWVSSLDGSRIATLGGRGNISLFREEESVTGNGPMPALVPGSLRLSANGSALIVGGRSANCTTRA